jgi:hypothetical protein
MPILSDKLSDKLSELTAMLEETVQVGKELLQNVAGQRTAMIAWDSDASLAWVEKKETLLQRLGLIDDKRLQLLPHLLPAQGQQGQQGQMADVATASLRIILSRLPDDPQVERLRRLQTQTQAVFRQLRQEEKQLDRSMQLLLEPLREALGKLVAVPDSLYGEKGTLTTPPAQPGLIQGKV